MQARWIGSVGRCEEWTARILRVSERLSSRSREQERFGVLGGELVALGEAHRSVELVCEAEHDVWIISEPIVVSQSLPSDRHLVVMCDL
jgi:hypothetical protein